MSLRIYHQATCSVHQKVRKKIEKNVFIDILSRFLSMNEWVSSAFVCKRWYLLLQEQRTFSHIKRKDIAESFIFPKIWDDKKWLTSIIKTSRVQVKLFLDISTSMEDPIDNEREVTPLIRGKLVLQKIVENCLHHTNSLRLRFFSETIKSKYVVRNQQRLIQLMQHLECDGGTTLNYLIDNLNQDYPLARKNQAPQIQPHRKYIFISDMDIGDTITITFIGVLEKIAKRAQNLHFEFINVGALNTEFVRKLINANISFVQCTHIDFDPRFEQLGKELAIKV